jgi:hypothetical protein
MRPNVSSPVCPCLTEGLALIGTRKDNPAIQLASALVRDSINLNSCLLGLHRVIIVIRAATLKDKGMAVPVARDSIKVWLNTQTLTGTLLK